MKCQFLIGLPYHPPMPNVEQTPATVHQRILVTGASGFVGRAVVDALLARGKSVVAYVRTRSMTIAHPNLTVIQGDLFDPERLTAAMVGCDGVVHLVGIIFENRGKGVTFERVHVEGTRAVVHAAKAEGVSRFVHMSALGARLDAPARYQSTKFAAEQIVRQSGLAYTIFRPSLILGPAGDFTQQMTAWARGQAIPWLFMPYFAKGVLGTGGASRVQPVAVDDLARVLADSIDLPQSLGRVFNLAGPAVMTWPEMYRAFSTKLLGKPVRTLGIPLWYAGLIARVTPGFLLPFNLDQVRMAAQDNIADTTEAQFDLNFRPGEAF